jgi:hypothetical protein
MIGEIECAERTVIPMRGTSIDENRIATTSPVGILESPIGLVLRNPPAILAPVSVGETSFLSDQFVRDDHWQDGWPGQSERSEHAPERSETR